MSPDARPFGTTKDVAMFFGWRIRRSGAGFVADARFRNGTTIDASLIAGLARAPPLAQGYVAFAAINSLTAR